MMPVIEVRNLGKEYQLGLTHTDLLSEKLGNGLKAIASRFRKVETDETNRKISREVQKQSFWALKDISFDVQQGEVMGVIGRNGAGKSTLLKLLSRITSPTTGEIRMRGRVASLLEVGTGFHPELTGRENIYLNGAILGMNGREISKKFDEIVSFAEVDKFIDTPVKRYSSGMYVRLAFSVAAHLEPEILVVDEVLAVGDLAFQKKCLSKMEDVAGAGRTVLFVSHNMASIKALCGSAMVLNDGNIEYLGSAHDAVSFYYEQGAINDQFVQFLDSQHKADSFLRICQLEFSAIRENEKRVHFSDSDIELRLGLLCSKRVSQVKVGIGLSREGSRLTTFHSESLEIEASEHIQFISCKISGGLLLPGFYEVQLGAHNVETGRGLDWIPDAAKLQVIDIPHDQTSDRDGHELGMVKLPSEWTELRI